jgi:hypothetical protein
MTTAGWVILITTWIFITGLCVFCFYRVLSQKKT